MASVKLQYDDNALDIVDKINGLLKNHGLKIDFVYPDEPKDGYEEVFIAKTIEDEQSK